jgi:acetyl esterase
MALDPQARKILQEAAGLPAISTLSVAEARKRNRDAALREKMGPAVAAVQTLDAHGVPVRFYRGTAAGNLPALVYFHGGGWVFNDLDTHDDVCRMIAHHSGWAVLSVDYRLAPEHKYPAAFDDAYSATVWAWDNAVSIGVDASKIAVGGDSAGGTLAAAVALRARNEKGPEIVFQALVYPITDYYAPGTPSYDEYADGYSLTREEMIWFWRHYLPDNANLDDGYLCPLRASDLRGLPPAYISTAEYDPLRDEGRRYADRLKAAGVGVSYHHYSDQMHGFVRQFPKIERGRMALIELADRLRLEVSG